MFWFFFNVLFALIIGSSDVWNSIWKWYYCVRLFRFLISNYKFHLFSNFIYVRTFFSKSVPIYSKLEKKKKWLCRCITKNGISWLHKECLNVNYSLSPINKNTSKLYTRNPVLTFMNFICSWEKAFKIEDYYLKSICMFSCYFRINAL